MNLKNKTALVTGASSGIGFEIAKKLGEEGAFLILHYHSNKDGIDALQKILSYKGIDSLAVQANFENRKDIEDMFDQIKDSQLLAGKNLDILINNVGQNYTDDDILDYDLWQKTFKVDIFSAVECTKLALTMMEKGKIINISSLYGTLKYGDKDSLAYSSAKAALSSFTYNMAKILAPNIIVNGIAPGYVDTEMWNGATDSDKKIFSNDQLIDRFIKSEEVAQLVIATLKNDAICGSILRIDGGLGIKTI